ncbi:hypothetical protein LOCC1_G002888 [Lachnellula occidentalis]|uniref:N-acetylgalactosaminide beta-1,3-galactosyltransferase n=1 Tax=Lachnellula occidentalis TaxID=215460 RepID=A0A8H8S666_9HELO|nr:hypothetical protein LOCC1_G002888 [Lachnellula occidentalis]
MARTGASEAALRVPALMDTSLRCAKHVYLYSDLDQDVGPYHVTDALDNVAQDVVANNSEFEFYHKQLELWKNKGDLSELQGLKSTPKDPALAEWTSSHYNTDLAAWQLDKYKFFHVLEKTWAAKPDMDWYVMIDSDTYVVWPTLLRWLETLDPSQKSYHGCGLWMDEHWFAHGGAGIVLSRAMMETLVYNNTAARWDPKMEKYCCGDFVLAVALKADYGVELQQAFPMFSQERWSTVPLGNENFWCRPAITFHHLTPAEMKEIADFEDNRLNTSRLEPWTHADIFRDFTMKSIPDGSYRANWDGTFASDRYEFDKYNGMSLEPKSFQDCIEACEADENCLQYTHHDETCYIGTTIRLGFKKEEDEGGICRVDGTKPESTIGLRCNPDAMRSHFDHWIFTVLWIKS